MALPRYYTEEEVRAAMRWPPVQTALEVDSGRVSLLTMPAYLGGGKGLGVKAVTIYRGNGMRG